MEVVSGSRQIVNGNLCLLPASTAQLRRRFLRVMSQSRPGLVKRRWQMLKFWIKSVSVKPLTSPSHLSWLRPHIRTHLCTEAFAPQKAIVKSFAHFFFLFLARYPVLITFLPRAPWKWNCKRWMRERPCLLLLLFFGACGSLQGRGQVTLESDEGHILKNNVNSYKKKIWGRSEPKIQTEHLDLRCEHRRAGFGIWSQSN